MSPDPATLSTRAQHCLAELGWTTWTQGDVLGWGNHNSATHVLNEDQQEAVLLVEHDRTLLPYPAGCPDGLSHLESGVQIRHVLGQAGMAVPQTIVPPNTWSGGTAMVLSRVPGRDVGQWLAEQRPMDARKLGKEVAHLVSRSGVLGQADPAHATGWGRHLYGSPGPHQSCLEAFHAWIAPLRGLRHDVGMRLGHLEWRAWLWLRRVERKTLIWDVGDRNVMLEDTPQGLRVAGLVDQVDLWSGDPLFVPGACWALFGDLGGGDSLAYEAGWHDAWEQHAEQWRRAHLWRVGALARQLGKAWRKEGSPPAAQLAQWMAACDQLLEEGDL